MGKYLKQLVVQTAGRNYGTVYVCSLIPKQLEHVCTVKRTILLFGSLVNGVNI